MKGDIKDFRKGKVRMTAYVNADLHKAFMLKCKDDGRYILRVASYLMEDAIEYFISGKGGK